MTLSKLFRVFFISAGVLLLVTGVAKAVSSFGSARILNTPDPIIPVNYKYIFWILGAMEICLGLFCISGKKLLPKSILLAWLATSFMIYRACLIWIHYQKPCPCLGSLTEALHVSPEVVNAAMKCVMVYLLVGSYTALFWLWQQHTSKVPFPPCVD